MQRTPSKVAEAEGAQGRQVEEVRDLTHKLLAAVLAFPLPLPSERKPRNNASCLGFTTDMKSTKGAALQKRRSLTLPSAVVLSSSTKLSKKETQVFCFLRYPDLLLTRRVPRGDRAEEGKLT